MAVAGVTHPEATEAGRGRACGELRAQAGSPVPPFLVPAVTASSPASEAEELAAGRCSLTCRLPRPAGFLVSKHMCTAAGMTAFLAGRKQRWKQTERPAEATPVEEGLSSQIGLMRLQGGSWHQEGYL